MKRMLTIVILVALGLCFLPFPVPSSAGAYHMGPTRTHPCKTFVCGKAKSVDVSRVYFPDGEVGTLRVYRDKNGKVIRITLDQ